MFCFHFFKFSMVKCASTIGSILRLTDGEKSAIMAKAAGLWSAADVDSNHVLDMEESKSAAFALSRIFAKCLVRLFNDDDMGISKSEWGQIVNAIGAGLEEHSERLESSRRRPPTSMLRSLETAFDHLQVNLSFLLFSFSFYIKSDENSLLANTDELTHLVLKSFSLLYSFYE